MPASWCLSISSALVRAEVAGLGVIAMPACGSAAGLAGAGGAAVAGFAAGAGAAWPAGGAGAAAAGAYDWTAGWTPPLRGLGGDFRQAVAPSRPVAARLAVARNVRRFVTVSILRSVSIGGSNRGGRRA